MSTSWDNARRHARALETALDAKLSTYSKIASTITRSGAGSSSTKPDAEELEDGAGGYKLVEEEIEELISKVSRVVSIRGGD
jgi:Golgi SNAP receptor complex protein 1